MASADILSIDRYNIPWSALTINQETSPKNFWSGARNLQKYLTGCAEDTVFDRLRSLFVVNESTASVRKSSRNQSDLQLRQRPNQSIQPGWINPISTCLRLDNCNPTSNSSFLWKQSWLCCVTSPKLARFFLLPLTVKLEFSGLKTLHLAILWTANMITVRSVRYNGPLNKGKGGCEKVRSANCQYMCWNISWHSGGSVGCIHFSLICSWISWLLFLRYLRFHFWCKTQSSHLRKKRLLGWKQVFRQKPYINSQNFSSLRKIQSSAA